MAVLRRLIQTVDSHTEGNPTRVIVGGVAVPPGRTLLDKREWLRTHDDGLRGLLNFEPRGNAMMCSVLLLPPLTEGADFAVIIIEQDEYVPMCGHCIIGAATTVVATGMIPPREPETRVTFETPAGLVTCQVAVQNGAVASVSLTNVPSFLLHRDAPVVVDGLGGLTVDVAFGGDFYALVDADRLGFELAPHNEAALVAAAHRIIPAVNAQLPIRHPDRPDIDRCYETLFTSRKVTTGDFKHTIVSPPGALDRSPCGTGTCARLATEFAKGRLGLQEQRRFEGVLGTCFAGQVMAVETRNDITYVIPRIQGRAYLTGFHQFVVEPGDPLPEGYRIGWRTWRTVHHQAQAR